MDGWRARMRSEWWINLPGLWLLGSALSIFALRLLQPEPAPDRPLIASTTLLGFLIAGIILLLSSRPQRRWCCLSQILLGSALIALALYSWLAHAGDIPALLSYSAPNSALGLALGGLAFLLLHAAPRQSPIYVALIALGMCMLAALGFVGLVLRFDPIFGWSSTVHMTSYTAIGLLLFAIGLAVIAWRLEKQHPHTATHRIVLLVAGVLTLTVMMGALLVYLVAATHVQWQAGERLSLVLNERVDHFELQLERALKKNQVLAARLQGARTPSEIRQLVKSNQDFTFISVRDKNAVFQKGNAAQLPDINRQLPVATAPVSLLYWQDGSVYLRLRRTLNGLALTTEMELPMESVLAAVEGIEHSGTAHLCAPLAPMFEGNLRCISHERAVMLQRDSLVWRVMQLALSGERGSGLFHDVGRRPVFLAYESLHGLGMVVEQDASDMYKALHRDLSLTLPMLLLLLLAGGGMIIWRMLPLATALHTSEQRFRDLVESSSDWVWEVDLRGVYTYVSPTIRKLLGYQPEEVLGKTPFELMPPDEAISISDKFKTIVDSAQPFQGLVNVNRHKDGHLVFLETSGVPFFDPLGNLAGYRGVDRDITQRKRLEQELRRSEAHYRLLANNANDMISLHHPDGRYHYVSPACIKLLGYQPEELVDHDAYEFIHPDDIQTVRNAHDTILRTPAQHRVVYRIRRKGNGYIWFETLSNVIQHSDTGSDEILAISRDVTLQKSHDQVLRSSELLHRSVISVLAEGVVIHAHDGTIISVNEAACTILGRTREQMLDIDSDDPDWAVIHENGAEFPGAEHPATITLRTGIPQRDIVMGVLRPDATRVWISVNTEPLLGVNEERLSGVVASFTDITSRREAEQELLKSRERLRALSVHLQQVQEQERSQLARELHDELGSSMTALKMDVNWILARLSCCEAELGARLRDMDQVLERAVRVVRRLVTELRPTILDDLGLWPALEWLIDEFSRHSGIKVKTDIESVMVPVAPPMALSIFRLLQEMLTNINKHAQASEVRVDFWCAANMLHMIVEDNGVGLSESRINAVNSHGIRGMEERVAQWGGKLEIHGSEGEGTLIHVRLPLQQCGDNEND